MGCCVSLLSAASLLTVAEKQGADSEAEEACAPADPSALEQ